MIGRVEQSGGGEAGRHHEGRGPVPREKPPADTVDRRTILVVEDERGVRELVRRILRGGGYDVVTAANVTEAVAVLDGTARVDLVLSDIVMPGGLGTELIRHVERRTRAVRLIFMSGYPKLVTGGEEPGCFPDGYPYLLKPFDAKTLLGTVRTLLEET